MADESLFVESSIEVISEGYQTQMTFKMEPCQITVVFDNSDYGAQTMGDMVSNLENLASHLLAAANQGIEAQNG